MCVTLAVHLPGSEVNRLRTGYMAKDRLSVQVAKYAAKHGIPYSQPFVSIAVYQKTNQPKGLAQVYGDMTAILNNDAVLPDIKVVCTDDFQDSAYNGYKKERAGGRVKKYLDRFADLSRMKDHEKLQALLEAANSHSDSKYAEARMFRPLRVSDVSRLLDSQGKVVLLPGKNPGTG